MKQPQYGGSKSLSDLNVIYALFQQSGDISTKSSILGNVFTIYDWVHMLYPRQ